VRTALAGKYKPPNKSEKHWHRPHKYSKILEPYQEKLFSSSHMVMLSILQAALLHHSDLIEKHARFPSGNVNNREAIIFTAD
jgi:hypothetical protein